MFILNFKWLDIEENIPLHSDNYKLTENSEFAVIKNKDAVQEIEDSIPDIIPRIGVEERLKLIQKSDEIKQLNNDRKLLK